MSAAPFSASFPIRSLDDVRQLEARPLAEALTVRSTYEIFRNSGAAFGDKTGADLPAQRRSGRRADPLVLCRSCWPASTRPRTCCTGSASGPDDAVAVLLPGCLEYHLALWGGEAAGIVQPLNPLLTDDKLAALMTAGRAKVLIAYGSDAESGMWSKAMRLRGQVPTLTTVLRVAPHDEAPGSAGELPEGVADFGALRAAEPDDRLVSGRDIAPGDIAAYFHTGGTTGAPKLARHSHGAQVFTAWASVNMTGQGPNDASINGYPLFHVGRRAAGLAGLAVGRRRSHHPDHRPAAQQAGAGQLLAAGREVPADLAVGGAHGARGAGQRAAGRRRHLVDQLLPHRRRGAVARARGALRAPVRPARAREPGHDRDGRHLDHHAARRGRARGLRRLPAALFAAAHRGARRTRQRQRTRRCPWANRAWCCSSRRTCSRASSIRPTTRRPSRPTAGWPPATSAGSTPRAGSTSAAAPRT